MSKETEIADAQQKRRKKAFRREQLGYAATAGAAWAVLFTLIGAVLAPSVTATGLGRATGQLFTTALVAALLVWAGSLLAHRTWRFWGFFGAVGAVFLGMRLLIGAAALGNL